MLKLHLQLAALYAMPLSAMAHMASSDEIITEAPKRAASREIVQSWPRRIGKTDALRRMLAAKGRK